MKKLFRVVIFIWLALWINFIARDLYKKGELHNYEALLGRDAEGKRAYTYGDHFYDFLEFAKKHLPAGASYKFEGVENLSLDYRRGVYFMYPCIEGDTSRYILVYKGKKYISPKFRPYAVLDSQRFILKRKE